MIQPFAALPGPAPRLESPAVPREAAPETSFADLLGDPGAETEVPAAQMIAVSPKAAMPPDRSSPEATPHDEKAVAERFNERGFFGRAVPAPEAPGAGATTASKPAAFAAQAAEETGLAPVGAQGACPAVATARRGSFTKAEAAPPASLGPAHRNGASGTVPQASPGQPMPAPAVGGEETEGALPTGSGRRLLGAAAERAARSAARVALSETGRGLHVAAFAQALPESERTRLRDEIAALLSRHGLRPDHIHIAARRVPPASA